MLPEMVKAITRLKEKQKLKVCLLKAHTIDRKMISDILKQTDPGIEIIDQDQGHNLINASDMIITTCGTANLEIAMIGVPFVACYRVHSLSYYLGIHLIKIKLYSIINILAKEKVVPELIQREFRSENIFQEVMNILENKDLKERMLAKFKNIKELLRQNTNPAEIMYTKIKRDLSI